MTLYLLRDESVIPPFFDLAKDLHPRTASSVSAKRCSPGPSR